MDAVATPPRLGAHRIIAIDPGTVQSAWVVLDDGQPIAHGLDPNDALLQRLRYGWPQDAAVVAIEKVESYGMTVGAEVFATVHWAGRFTEAARPMPVVQVPRRKVKVAICGDSKAKDKNIRQAIIDRFGGQAVAIGLKATPGPLYGIRSDEFQALAVGCTYHDDPKVAA